jgi:hypothetical protein
LIFDKHERHGAADERYGPATPPPDQLTGSVKKYLKQMHIRAGRGGIFAGLMNSGLL